MILRCMHIPEGRVYRLLLLPNCSSPIHILMEFLNSRDMSTQLDTFSIHLNRSSYKFRLHSQLLLPIWRDSNDLVGKWYRN